MKLSSITLFFAFFKSGEASYRISSINVTHQNSYALLNDLPLFDERLQTKVMAGHNFGGTAFIDGNDPNFMFLIKNAEVEPSEILRVPLLRDPANGQILGLDFASNFWESTPLTEDNYTKQAPTIISEPYIAQISATVDPNGKWWYSTVCGYSGKCAGGSTYESPHKNCYGTFNSATNSYTTEGCIDGDTWTALGLTYPYPGGENHPFTGFWGMDFTADGTIVGTSPYGLFEATMDWSTYAPQSVVQRCEIPNIKFLGSLAHIPSGTYKNDLMIANYDKSGVAILQMNGATRECLTDPSNGEPLITPLVDGFSDAWGIWFDPFTNNFMANSWYNRYSEFIYQLKGFVPGINHGSIKRAIYANGNQILAAAGQQRNLVRRGLAKLRGGSTSEGQALKELTKTIAKNALRPEFVDVLVEAVSFLEESEYYQNCLDSGENDPDSIRAYISMADTILGTLSNAQAEIESEYPSQDFAALFEQQTRLFTELRNACTGQVVSSLGMDN